MTAHVITAIMSVYNGERFIAEALQSMLDQTRKPDQIVVVDDGSTDRTADVLRTFPSVEVVSQANARQAAALNNGIRHARGDLLCFLDADDVWLPEKTALQEVALLEDPALDMVFGHAVQFREGVPGEGPPQPGPTHATVLIRRSSFARVGDFDTSYRLGPVFDWFARAQGMKLRSRMLEHVVMRRRIHGANIGITQKNDRHEYLIAVKAALDRKRRGTTT